MADLIPAPHTFASPRRQLFSFPPDVIRSMLNDPSSPKGLLKLYQTCKYFFGKKPILVANSLRFRKDRICVDERVLVATLTVPCWVTEAIFLENFRGRLPLLFRSSVKEIRFTESKLHFDDFKYLCSKNLVKITSDESRPNIYCSDLPKYWPKATIEEVLQLIPNIKVFQFSIDKKCSLESLIKLNEIKLSNKFDKLTLKIKSVHPTFDLNLFCSFVVNNTHAYSQINLRSSKKSRKDLRQCFQKLRVKWQSNLSMAMRMFFNEIYRKWEQELDIL